MLLSCDNVIVDCRIKMSPHDYNLSMEGTITITMKEMKTINVLQQLIDDKIDNNQAARELGLTIRQIQRKKKNFKLHGPKSVIHKNKGKPSGRGYPSSLKEEIVQIYKSEYNGWNFSHFNEHLELEHNLRISQTVIYGTLTSAGVKSPSRKKRKPKGHPPRARKEFAGELVQVDASDHAWIELSGERHHLHGAIDDATNIVLSCVLQPEETAYGYQLMLKEIIENYGIPACLYTDFRTVFQSPKKLTPEEELAGKEIGATRYGEMLEHLGVDIESTMSPQAKGRIERLWRTFQDRLVKELRKEHITSLEEANRYIKEVFLPRYNAKHASLIDYNKNMFIPVPEDFDYNTELALRAHQRVCHGTYIQSDGNTYAIFKDGAPRRISTSLHVDVFICLDGTRKIHYKNEWYELKKIERVKPPKAVKPKRTQAETNAAKAHEPASNHPWRLNMMAKTRRELAMGG